MLVVKVPMMVEMRVAMMKVFYDCDELLDSTKNRECYLEVFLLNHVSVIHVWERVLQTGPCHGD
jgi:hypothetical protein